MDFLYVVLCELKRHWKRCSVDCYMCLNLIDIDRDIPVWVFGGFGGRYQFSAPDLPYAIALLFVVSVNHF